MNNKTIVWLIVAIVAFAGVWYLLAPSLGGLGIVPPTATTTPPTTAATQSTATKSPVSTAPKPTKTTAKMAGIGSLNYLLGLKQPLICSVKTTSGYARSGTMYVSAGGQARANFISSTMIDDGSYLYAWANGATTGTKLVAGLSASGSAITYAGGVDLTTDLSFSCNPWTVDISFFAPPATVSF